MPDRAEGLTFSIPKGMEFGPRAGTNVGFWLAIVNDEGRDKMERVSAFIQIMQLAPNVQVTLDG